LVRFFVLYKEMNKNLFIVGIMSQANARQLQPFGQAKKGYKELI